MNLTARMMCATALAATVAMPAAAQNVAVTFGTNWVAQAEHGGFYQSVADGTYAACGLDVTIIPGGPQVNNRALMIAGKVDYHMGGNLLEAFSAAAEGIPIVAVAASFQKEPQVILTHPGKAATFEDLKKLDGPLAPHEQRLVDLYDSITPTVRDEALSRLTAWNTVGCPAESGVETFYHKVAAGEVVGVGHQSLHPRVISRNRVGAFSGSRFSARRRIRRVLRFM